MKRFHIHGTALEVADLCVAKNRAYGDSVGKSAQALALLYKDGLRADQYLDALIFAREFDKHSRIAAGNDAFGEDPRLDIAGYALLALHFQKENQARCQGAASSIPAPAASAAPATPDSAASPANESTTPKSGEPSGPKNSPSPDGSSASTSASALTSTASAPAPTASTPAPASANAAARASDVGTEVLAHLLCLYIGFCIGEAIQGCLSWFYLPPFILLLVAFLSVRVYLRIKLHHAPTHDAFFFDEEAE